MMYDGNDIVAEIQGGVVTTTYLRGLNIDEPFIRQSSSGNEFYHTDALGSVLALTDQTGAVQTTYRYDPFGNTTVTGTSTNPFQYAGRENDGTGMYYYRARYYSPKMQRFLGEDPIGFAGGDENLYAYVWNNPLKWIDPHGLILADPREQPGGGSGNDRGPIPPINLPGQAGPGRPGGTNPMQLPPWFIDRLRDIRDQREINPPIPPESPWMPPLDPPPCMTVGGRKPHAC